MLKVKIIARKQAIFRGSKSLLNSELDFAGAQLLFGNRRAIAITESGGIALFKRISKDFVNKRY